MKKRLDLISVGEMVLRRDLFRFAYIRPERVEPDQKDPHAYSVVIVFDGDLSMVHSDATNVDLTTARKILDIFKRQLLED